MKRNIDILFMLLIFLPSMNAQKFVIDDDFIDNYAFKVKQISEFMSRFNLEMCVITPEQDSLWRVYNRVLLFDRETYETNQHEADSLIRMIEKDTIQLHYSDTTWTAYAKCRVSYMGKEDSILLALRPELRGEDMYKWVIVEVSGNLLSLPSKTHSEHFYISPVDNELNFMSLSQITKNNSSNIMQYAGNQFALDALSVFYAMIYTKQLRILNVQELTYHFDLPHNHSFDVGYFNRISKNSGWLIFNFN